MILIFFILESEAFGSSWNWIKSVFLLISDNISIFLWFDCFNDALWILLLLSSAQLIRVVNSSDQLHTWYSIGLIAWPDYIFLEPKNISMLSDEVKNKTENKFFYCTDLFRLIFPETFYSI